MVSFFFPPRPFFNCIEASLLCGPEASSVWCHHQLPSQLHFFWERTSREGIKLQDRKWMSSDGILTGAFSPVFQIYGEKMAASLLFCSSLHSLASPAVTQFTVAVPCYSHVYTPAGNHDKPQPFQCNVLTPSPRITLCWPDAGS